MFSFFRRGSSKTSQSTDREKTSQHSSPNSPSALSLLALGSKNESAKSEHKEKAVKHHKADSKSKDKKLDLKRGKSDANEPLEPKSTVDQSIACEAIDSEKVSTTPDECRDFAHAAAPDAERHPKPLSLIGSKQSDSIVVPICSGIGGTESTDTSAASAVGHESINSTGHGTGIDVTVPVGVDESDDKTAQEDNAQIKLVTSCSSLELAANCMVEIVSERGKI